MYKIWFDFSINFVSFGQIQVLLLGYGGKTRYDLIREEFIK